MGFFKTVLIISFFLNLASSQSYFGRRFILNDLIAPEKVSVVSLRKVFCKEKQNNFYLFYIIKLNKIKLKKIKLILFCSQRAYFSEPGDATEDLQQFGMGKPPLGFAKFDGPIACR